MSKRKSKSIAGWPVMKSKCPTCPFGPKGDEAIRDMVTQRVLGEASQICHGPRLHGQPETHLCRGARDLQLQTFAAMGFIAAPTDEAWDAKCAELGITPNAVRPKKVKDEQAKGSE